MVRKTEEGDTAKLSVRIDAGLLLRLKVGAAQRGTKMQAAVAEAIAMWLDSAPRRRAKR